eukprot:g6965.t1
MQSANREPICYCGHCEGDCSETNRCAHCPTCWENYEFKYGCWLSWGDERVSKTPPNKPRCTARIRRRCPFSFSFSSESDSRTGSDPSDWQTKTTESDSEKTLERSEHDFDTEKSTEEKQSDSDPNASNGTERQQQRINQSSEIQCEEDEPQSENERISSPRMVPVEQSLSPKMVPVEQSLSPKMVPVEQSLSPKMVPMEQQSLSPRMAPVEQGLSPRMVPMEQSRFRFNFDLSTVSVDDVYMELLRQSRVGSGLLDVKKLLNPNWTDQSSEEPRAEMKRKRKESDKSAEDKPSKQRKIWSWFGWIISNTSFSL